MGEETIIYQICFQAKLILFIERISGSGLMNTWSFKIKNPI